MLGTWQVCLSRQLPSQFSIGPWLSSPHCRQKEAIRSTESRRPTAPQRQGGRPKVRCGPPESRCHSPNKQEVTDPECNRLSRHCTYVSIRLGSPNHAGMMVGFCSISFLTLEFRPIRRPWRRKRWGNKGNKSNRADSPVPPFRTPASHGPILLHISTYHSTYVHTLAIRDSMTPD